MKNAQYLAETVIVISIVIAAIIGMQTYVRRSVQANMKKGIDLGVQTAQINIDQFNTTSNQSSYFPVSSKPLMQYEAYYTDEKLNYGIKRAVKESNQFVPAEKAPVPSAVKPACNNISISCVSSWASYYVNLLSDNTKQTAFAAKKAAGLIKDKGNLNQDSYYSSGVKSQSKSYFDTSSNAAWQQ